MIRIRRAELPEAMAVRLAAKTAKIEGAASARKLWREATSVRKLVKQHLQLMASGRGYCMYCGDGIGSDIDHHEPIRRNPARTFDWLNHLLACAFCNSHHKRDQYPVDDSGTCLLIDPTAEDPLDHLFLALSMGKYRGLTEKGEQTIKVCGLNRPLLERGRQLAFSQVRYAVRAWSDAHASADMESAARALWTLRDQPHADVLQAMFRQVDLPGARDIFDGDDQLIATLRFPGLRSELVEAI